MCFRPGAAIRHPGVLTDTAGHVALITEAVVMDTLHERYVVDRNGQRIGVLLDIAEYHKLLEEVEELEAIRAYDAAKASGDEIIPFEQAVAEIEQNCG
jgi:hypothetical protein